MKVNESISPSVFKNLAIVIGLFIVFSVWQAVNAKIADLRYQPVQGESFSSGGASEKIDLKSLPIVVAQSQNTDKSIGGKTADDMAIEAAFKVPEFSEVEVEVATQAPKITNAERLFVMYRPAVGAVSLRGAVINGVFWKTGESLESMPINLDDGQIVFPVLSGVTRTNAVLSVGGEKLTLPFERF